MFIYNLPLPICSDKSMILHYFNEIHTFLLIDEILTIINHCLITNLFFQNLIDGLLSDVCINKCIICRINIRYLHLENNAMNVNFFLKILKQILFLFLYNHSIVARKYIMV